MGRTFGFIALIIVVGIGGYVYLGQMQTLTPKGSTPTAAIEVTGVRNDLIAIANAERRYFATSGKYATLEELRANNDITIANRANYTYSAEIGDTTFKIIATYSGEDPHAPIRISMDESMDMKSE
jgi:hypothetical protein